MKQDVRHSEQGTIKVNDIEIAYDTFGDPDAPPVLLIMGLALPMVAWHNRFCAELASRGYGVIRFDNRDVGLSTKLDEAGVPNPAAMIQARQRREPVEAPYTLRDMADDAVGLLDALDIESAHIAGLSMGGMIAQTMAIYHPERVSTLTSVSSTTGDPRLPPPKPEAFWTLMTPVPTNRAEYVEFSLRAWQALTGPGYPIDGDLAREVAGRCFDRGVSPTGTTRQLAAIIASGSRRRLLESVTTPTLVIHGGADPLIPIEGGIQTAETIRGAGLLIIEGMGHALPATPQAWSQIIDAIASHAM